MYREKSNINMYREKPNIRQRGSNEAVCGDLRMVRLPRVVYVAHDEMLLPDDCSETLFISVPTRLG